MEHKRRTAVHEHTDDDRQHGAWKHKDMHELMRNHYAGYHAKEYQKYEEKDYGTNFVKVVVSE